MIAEGANADLCAMAKSGPVAEIGKRLRSRGRRSVYVQGILYGLICHSRKGITYAV